MQLWLPRTRQCILCSLRYWRLQSRSSYLHERKRSISYAAQRHDQSDRSSQNATQKQDVSEEDGQPVSSSNSDRQGLLREFSSTLRNDIIRKGQYRLRLDHRKPKTTADGNKDEATPHEIKQQRFLHALQRLQRRLQQSRSPHKAKIDDLDKLDPYGTKRAMFEAEVRKLASDPDGKHTKQEKALMDKLNAAEAVSLQSLNKEMYFAYLDVLAGIGPSSIISPQSGFGADLRYPTEWYARARAQQREIHLHVGPTNSGKTYTALKRLQESGNGFYAGPLRLLAHEVYSRFKANGVPCDLVTGDDIRFDENADTKLAASTVEMVNTNKEVEVAVIDEIQMMSSTERGWAWTRAFLGANAKEVHLAGETRVVPLIRELAASMGDTLHVHHYDRLNPLKAMSRSLRGDLKNLRKGDCVVSFTIQRIHALKREIELQTGRRVAIVYGSLPPETRAQQADLFNNPDNDYDYLVASDAIGMGLNLSVKRIIFETLTKFNGVVKEQLSIPQIKQIAGRAGRFRTAQDDKAKTDPRSKTKPNPLSVGLVTCIDEVDLPVIQKALKSEPPPLRTAGIQPPAEYIEEFAARLPAGLPFEFVLQRIFDSAKVHPRFKICDAKDNLHLARQIDHISGLTIAQRVNLTAAPVSRRDEQVIAVFRALAQVIADPREVTVADVLEIPLEILEQPVSPQPEYLSTLVALHKSLILFLWLSYRFVSKFTDQDMAIRAKTLCEDKINETLREFSANTNLRKRLQKIKAQQRKMLSEAAQQEANNDQSGSMPALDVSIDRGDNVSGESADAGEWSERPSSEFPVFDEELADRAETGMNLEDEHLQTDEQHEERSAQATASG